MEIDKKKNIETPMSENKNAYIKDFMSKSDEEDDDNYDENMISNDHPNLADDHNDDPNCSHSSGSNQQELDSIDYSRVENRRKIRPSRVDRKPELSIMFDSVINFL